MWGRFGGEVVVTPPHFGQGITPKKTIAEAEPMILCVSEQCPLCDLVRGFSKLGFLSAAKHDVTLGMKMSHAKS